jgi:hypothetical protein
MQTPSNSPLPAPKNRETLRQYFSRGSLPTEQSFADLINSTVNRLDDSFTYSPDQGWQVAATQEYARLLALYQNSKSLEANQPTWFIELPTEDVAPGGLSFSVPAQHSDSAVDDEPTDPNAPPTAPPNLSRLHLQADGNVGIGTATPTDKLDVRGTVASQGRIGTYADAHYPGTEVPADGNWYPILSNLDGLHAFEIVAAAYGTPGQGRYALTHATVLSAFGKSRSRIFRKSSWFWGWFQKIQFRWTGSLHSYGLEMRTASSFGADGRIVYHITHLFDDRRPQLAPAAGPVSQ